MTGLARALLVFGVVFVFFGCVSTKEYEARLSEVEGLRQKMNEQADSYQQEVKELNEKIVKLNGEKKELVDANAELAQQMEASKLELVRQNTGLQAQLKEGELKIHKLEDELSLSEKKGEDLNTEVAVLEEEKQKALEAKKEAVADLQGTYDELVRELNEEIQKGLEAKKEAVADLQGTYDELVGELNEEIQKGRIEVSQLQDKLSLSMVDKILFDSGSAAVKPGGRKVLDRVAEILVKVEGKQIRIEGHTDDVLIGPGLQDRFPTNWELSAARATTVVRYLAERGGIEASKLSAAGYSMYRPVVSNETPEGKAKNRRIAIVLIPEEMETVEAETGEGQEKEEQEQ
jgi:chemotaxis protein MotB